MRISKIHPFRLHLLQTGTSISGAARGLRVTRNWLSQVLGNRVDASGELYRDMVKYSKGAVTLKELTAYRKPSEHRRRKLVDLKPLRRKKAPKAQAAQHANGEDTVH